MTPEFITGYFMEAIRTAIMLAGPILMTGLIVAFWSACFRPPRT